MWWKWRRVTTEDPATDSTEHAASAPGISVTQDEEATAELQRATDTLAAVLRAFGKHAFDLETTNARAVNEACELWARHILVGTPRPGDITQEAATTRVPTDWAGVRRFVTQQRRSEGEYVNRALNELREVIWSFIHNLSRTVLDDQSAGGQMAGQLQQLRSAVSSNSMEQLKHAAMATVTAIEQSVEERRKRQKIQLEELGNRLRSLRQELEEARREMSLDPLTQLYNRKAFDQQVARTIDLGLLSGEPACLFMVDIDHFKSINDTFGHPAGDAVIKEIADCCTRTFPRKMDFVARYGGEEFAIIVQDTAAGTARLLGQRLLDAISALAISHNGREIRVTASIGISESNAVDSVATLLKRADDALYQAKQTGRNRVIVAE
jgi:diguanylate cyclase (GGDEF)-like protein